MRKLQTISAVVGFGALALGLLAGLQDSRVASFAELGKNLLTTGAIIIAALLISAAIVEAGRKP